LLARLTPGTTAALCGRAALPPSSADEYSASAPSDTAGSSVAVSKLDGYWLIMK
jgi:hypothetical protein